MDALELRYQIIMLALSNLIARKTWIDSMAYLMNNRKHNLFRWHDAGDIQSVDHLRMIVEVVELTPQIKHWLPTKEYALITRYKKEFKTFPKNLIVRVSAPMLDTRIKGFKYTSSIVKNSTMKSNCNAYKNQGKCLDCRLCWNKSIKDITYKYH